MIWKLSDVVPNPFRNLHESPYQEWRIKKLMDSIGSNGFRENVEGRERNGKLQLAFGHHRVEAMRRLGLIEAKFTEKELTDLQMLRSMTEENETEYKHGLEVVFEAVIGAVRAFADGRIKPEIEKNTAHKYLRYAPWYTPDPKPVPTGAVPYTALSVARALCKVESDGHGGIRANHVVSVVLLALQLLELHIIPRSFLFFEGDALKEYESGCQFGGNVYAMEAALCGVWKRTLKTRAEAAKVAADDAAHVVSAQSNLAAFREEKANERAARRADVARLSELAEEGNEEEAKRRAATAKENEELEKVWAEARAREEKEKVRTATKEFRAQRRAINKRAKEAKEAEEAARKETRKAEAAEAAEAAARKAGKKPEKPYWPELTALINHFEKDLPFAAARVLRDKARLTEGQKAAIRKAIDQSARKAEEFWNQLNPNGAVTRCQ